MGSFCLGLSVFVYLDVCFLPQVRKVFSYISSNKFSVPFSFSSPSGTPIVLMFSQMSLKLSSLFFILFSIFCSAWMISTILSSSLLICSSVSSNLMLISSIFFLNFSYCILQLCFFLYISSSFLNFTLCSSILLPSSLSIFMIITLNSLLAMLLISTLLRGFILFLCLEHIPLSPYLAKFSVLISVY